MEWHDIRDPNDPELDRLAARYNLHPLHIEDCRHRDQNAKVEEQNGYLFVVLKPAIIAPNGDLEFCDLDVFLGRTFLITVQEQGSQDAKAVIERLGVIREGLRGDQALYRIADGIVDSYLPKLDHFSEVIDGLEDDVIEDPGPDVLVRIFAAKRGLIQLRRILVNTRDVAGHLLRSDSGLIGRDMWPFFRDVFDHLARSLDLLETQRDLLNGSLDIYLSSISNRTNRVVKVLTVLGTIALPALVVSSFYGMNVEGLPWSHDPHAFAIVMAVVLSLTAGFLVLLRRLRWL